MLARLRRVPRELIGLYWDSGVVNDVPALAWFLISSLVPLALGLTALAAVALGDYARAQELSTRISQVLPKDVHDQIVNLILRTKEQSPLWSGSAPEWWACSSAACTGYWTGRASGSSSASCATSASPAPSRC